MDIFFITPQIVSGTRSGGNKDATLTAGHEQRNVQCWQPPICIKSFYVSCISIDEVKLGVNIEHQPAARRRAAKPPRKARQGARVLAGAAVRARRGRRAHAGPP